MAKPFLRRSRLRREASSVAVAHNQVLALGRQGSRGGQVRSDPEIPVMAGCDGRMKSREYYTNFAEKLPKDTIILTAGCAKYRYNKLKLGDIGGIPRVLDAGQCKRLVFVGRDRTEAQGGVRPRTTSINCPSRLTSRGTRRLSSSSWRSCT